MTRKLPQAPGFTTIDSSKHPFITNGTLDSELIEDGGSISVLAFLLVLQIMGSQVLISTRTDRHLHWDWCLYHICMGLGWRFEILVKHDRRFSSDLRIACSSLMNLQSTRLCSQCTLFDADRHAI
jgi:hypothetical protein